MIKFCKIVDEYTRQHVAFALDHKLDAVSVIELLDVACLDQGWPPKGDPGVDNGYAFIAQALRDWAQEDETIQVFIPPDNNYHPHSCLGLPQPTGVRGQTETTQHGQRLNQPARKLGHTT